MEVMICGDWHADTMHGISMLHKANKRRVKEIFVCGDFGYWPREPSLAKYVPTLEKKAAEFDIDILWIDGNHEDFEMLATWEDTEHVRYLKRGSCFTRENTRFAACGGAYSIDRQHRILGSSYFNEELTTLQDAYKTIANAELLGGCDVLLTHDAPTCSPVLDEWKRDVITMGNRELIQGLYETLRPAHLFHGHYHTFYKYRNITGLARNEMPNSYVFFDTERGM